MPYELRKKMYGDSFRETVGRIVEHSFNGVLKEGGISGSYLVYRVEVETKEPLPPGVFFKGENMNPIWIMFKYQKLPNLCYKCGRMCHEMRQCGEVVPEPRFEYGFWMKAEDVAEYTPAWQRYWDASKEVATEIGVAGKSGVVIEELEDSIEETAEVVPRLSAGAEDVENVHACIGEGKGGGQEDVREHVEGSDKVKEGNTWSGGGEENEKCNDVDLNKEWDSVNWMDICNFADISDTENISWSEWIKDRVVGKEAGSKAAEKVGGVGENLVLGQDHMGNELDVSASVVKDKEVLNEGPVGSETVPKKRGWGDWKGDPRNQLCM